MCSVFYDFFSRSELVVIKTEYEQSLEEEKLKFQDLEEKLQLLNKDSLSDKNEMIGMRDKLQVALSENNILIEERATFEQTQKALEERDIEISSLVADLQSSRGQLELLIGKEKDLTFKLEERSQEKLKLEEVVILLVILSSLKICFLTVTSA